jgi:hypothetical protein
LARLAGLIDLTVLIDEQVHHGAEIGVPRDLYRCRQPRS